MFQRALICILFTISLDVFSQENQFPKLYANKLVKSETFNKINRNDLNFLIIGENNPKQGLELAFDDDKSMITAGGYITSYENWLLTMEGEFSSKDGIYFFDNNNGSKSSKFTLNFFTSFCGVRGFDNISESANKTEDKTQKTQRAFIKRFFYERDSIKKIKEDYYILREIMISSGLPVDEMKNGELYIDKDSLSKPDREIITNRLKEYLVDKKKVDVKTIEKVVVHESKDKEFIEVRTWKILKNLKKIKVIEDYEKAKLLYENKKDSLMKKEVDFTKSSWNYKSFWYFGVSPSYTRENITLYNANSTEVFDKRFDDQRGDLFSAQLQLNWFRQSRDGKYFLIRGLSTWGRGSNLSSFTKNTFGVSEPTDQTVNDTPILLNKSKEGYTGLNPYKYGSLQLHQFELFGSLNKSFGLFSTMGFRGVNYGKSSGIEKEEKIPFRIGGFINLTSKKETKTVLIVQVFADRSDLKSDPSVSNDWRFGFKIGLPVNIGKEL